MASWELTKRQQYQLLHSQLLLKRAGFVTAWQETATYLLPTRIEINTPASERDRGDRRNQSIINNTGTDALRTLEHGMHAGITSPARPWFRLGPADPAMATYAPVKRWLHDTTLRMQTLLARSNLYTALPMVYSGLGCFGTEALAQLPDIEDTFRFYQYPIGSYVLGIDSRGRPSTFIREYSMTVRELIREFAIVPGTKDIDWSKVSVHVKHLWLQGSFETRIDLCWVVAPNVGRDPNKWFAKDRMPWVSCHYEKAGEEDKYLRESGFETFPIHAPRWRAKTDDIYATEWPASVAIGDVKALQIIEKRAGQAVELFVRPPVTGPTSLKTAEVSTVPGGVTYVDSRDGMQGFRSVWEPRLEGVQHLNQIQARHEFRIERAFYADLFQTLLASARNGDTPDRTAREIEELHQEKLLAMGPVLEALNDDLLDPLIDRTFLMMLNAGLIEPPPRELQGTKLRVEYLSIMSQAQKLVGVVGLDRFVQSSMAMANLWPIAKHKVVVERVINDYADMYGVDPNTVRDDDEAQEMADSEAQQAQAALASQNMKTVAQAGQALGNTPMAGTTALEQVVGGAM